MKNAPDTLDAETPPTTPPAVTADLQAHRHAVIEECARRLDAESDKYVQRANTARTHADQNWSFDTAHIYHTAADQLRHLIPGFTEARQRDRERALTAMEALDAGNPQDAMAALKAAETSVDRRRRQNN